MLRGGISDGHEGARAGRVSASIHPARIERINLNDVTPDEFARICPTHTRTCACVYLHARMWARAVVFYLRPVRPNIYIYI